MPTTHPTTTATPTPARPHLVTETVAAEHVGRTRQTIRNWINRGYITAYKEPGCRGTFVDLFEVRHLIRTAPRSRVRRSYNSFSPKARVVTVSSGSAS